VLSGGRMSGYGVILCLYGFLLLLLSSLPFRFVLEISLLCFSCEDFAQRCLAPFPTASPTA
jgi:hypothetical protein